MRRINEVECEKCKKIFNTNEHTMCPTCRKEYENGR